MENANPPPEVGTGVNDPCGGEDLTHDPDDGIWNQIMARIKKKPKEGRHRYIFPNDAMSEEETLDECAKEGLNMQRHYLNNKIRTTKYTVLSFLPKNLFEQFHRFANCYFVFIVLLNFIPAIGAIQPILSLVPVVVILLVQALKDVLEDYGRYKSDGVVNNSKTEVYRREDDKYHSLKWEKVRVGDIVRLFCNGVIPADVLLLHSSDERGVCYIETSNIDGETNLKQRLVCKGMGQDFHAKDFKSLIQCEKPNSQIDKFTGNIITPGPPATREGINKENLLLRGCVIRNTDYVEGIVVYAGHETKAMLNNNGPRYKRSKLERRMNLDVIWCVVLLIVMCLTGAVGNAVWAAYQSTIPQTVLFIPPTDQNETLDPALSGFFMFWTMLILLQVLIPISLYVSIEIVKVGQVYFINNDFELYDEDTDKSLECRALNITEDLGQVQYVFSDKTGTLTENSMVFRRCTVGGVDYPHAANAARIENKEPTRPDMNPASNMPQHHSSHPHLRTAVSLGNPSTLNRDDEHRASYRRPKSGSVRAHHRRNPSSLSVQQLRNTVSVPGSASSVPNSPDLRRATVARASHHKVPQKHHRRNISTVSAKEIQSTLAKEDVKEELSKDIFPHQKKEGEEESEQDQFLEEDVTPDPVLYEELEAVSRNPFDLEVRAEKRRVLDFFINLAICNTVVLSADNPHLKPREHVVSVSSPREEKFRSLVNGASLLEESDDTLHTISGKVDKTGDSIPVPSQSESTASTSRQSFTAEYLRNIRYEAESPDEAALVYAAHAYGFSLAHRTKNSVTVSLPESNDTMSFEVLHTLTFDSVRKRMSVIVRDCKTRQYILYCKGADSTILELLKNPLTELPEDTNPEANHQQWRMSYLDSNSTSKCKYTKTFLDQYARTGLRTLCIAKRVLSSDEYSLWLTMHQLAEQAMEGREEKVFESYVAIEKDLELLGATGIEDRLQDGVPETIESLRKAGMQVWVITGDKQETAVNISYACKLIEPGDDVIYLNADSLDSMKDLIEQHTSAQEQARGPIEDVPPDPDSSFLSLQSFFVQYRSRSHSSTPSQRGSQPPLSIVIDGKSLQFALSKDLQKAFIKLARRCHSVLVCRATPLQKGEVVKLVKEELHVMTLAIGDGANDVSMIQVADIGVGISGQEGMQAVMSSDFAMAKFRFLQRLLLVHGHWNYARLAMMVLYFFYKNAAFVFLIFWFQFFCGYSGANPIEQWYLLLYSLVFTSVPPLINGVLDKDLSSETLIRKPRLYLQGINCEMYTARTFWIHMIDAIYQSVALFFIPYFTYLDSDVGMITWGTPVTTACMFANLIHLGIETKTWTWIHWLGQIGSIVLFFAFSLVYNSICPACFPPSNPYWIMETLVQTSNFWFSVILATAIALLPRYLIRSLQSNLWPTECQRERVIEKLMNKKERNSTTTTNTPINTGSSGSSTYQNASYDEHRNGSAVDALQYHFPDQNSLDPMYQEFPSNANQNNRVVKPKLSPSGHVNSRPSTAPSAVRGLENPAYIEEGTKRSEHEEQYAVAQESKEIESETGETPPDFLQREVLNALLRSSYDIPAVVGVNESTYPPDRTETIESGALHDGSSIDTFDNTVA